MTPTEQAAELRRIADELDPSASSRSTILQDQAQRIPAVNEIAQGAQPTTVLATPRKMADQSSHGSLNTVWHFEDAPQAETESVTKERG